MRLESGGHSNTEVETSLLQAIRHFIPCQKQYMMAVARRKLQLELPEYRTSKAMDFNLKSHIPCLSRKPDNDNSIIPCSLYFLISAVFTRITNFLVISKLY